MAMFVKFWGARGSIPTPASWTRVYGGNTSCVEIRSGDHILICDAGSGIRELGKDLLGRNPFPSTLHLFITHTHWDHIQGFPFFAPAYRKATRIQVYSPGEAENHAYRLLSGQMSSEYFPVSFNDLGADIVPARFGAEGLEIGGVAIRTFRLNHPGGCHGYSFAKEEKKIVYLTDNEFVIQPEDLFPDPGNEGNLRNFSPELLEAARGADLLVADAQYDDREYSLKKGWGHSSCASVTDFAIRAQVKNLALFHHDPESTDRAIDAKIESCCQRASKRGASLDIFAAREGLELKF